MPLLRPDPSFYPSPGMAMQAPPESLAYVALLNVGKNGKRDAMGVIDLEPRSPHYGQLIGQVDFPHGDMRAQACAAGVPAEVVQLIDTKKNPRQPKIVKVIAVAPRPDRDHHTGEPIGLLGDRGRAAALSSNVFASIRKMPPGPSPLAEPSALP